MNLHTLKKNPCKPSIMEKIKVIKKKKKRKEEPECSSSVDAEVQVRSPAQHSGLKDLAVAAALA